MIPSDNQRGTIMSTIHAEGNLFALYRMTRGSDSVRPRVMRKLAADAAR
jgi:hypothetical protein